MGYIKKIGAYLEKPHAIPGVAFIALVLSLPTLFGGFALDDHYFRMIFQQCPGMPELDLSPLETFTFGGGTPELNLVRMNRGLLPWWADPYWQTSFWRPVTSLTHWGDYVLWGDRAWPMHLGSILLYSALAAALTFYYRRLLPSAAVAGIAALLFAIDDAHGFPVAWLSSRNAILSCLFGVLALIFHDGWRRNGWRFGLPVALATLLLAVFSAEGAVAIVAYLLAYAIFIDKSRPWARVLSLAPYLATLFVWRIVYSALGHGTTHSMVYIDPIGDPIRFFRATLFRLPEYLYGQMGLSDPTMGSIFPQPYFGITWTFIVAFLGFAAWIMWPLIRSDETLRFCLFGMVLSAIPACATIPQSRLLFFTGIGGMPLVASFLVAVNRKSAALLYEKRRPTPAKALAYFMLLTHGLIAPAMFLTSALTIVPVEAVIRKLNESLPQHPGLTEQTLVVARSHIDVLPSGFPILRSSLNQPIPLHTWQLTSGLGAVTIERTDEKTLLVRPEEAIHPRNFTQVFQRPPNRPMRPGQRVSLDGLEIEVISVTPDGRPVETKFHFSKNLDDPSFIWTTMDKGPFVTFAPPPVGERISLPRQPLGKVLLGAVNLL